MLALIFVTLATGLQLEQNDLNGAEWDATAAAEVSRPTSDAYRKLLVSTRSYVGLTSRVQWVHLCKHYAAQVSQADRRFSESRPSS